MIFRRYDSMAVTARRPLAYVTTTQRLGRCGYARPGTAQWPLITVVGNGTGRLSDLRVSRVIGRTQRVATARQVPCLPLCPVNRKEVMAP
jgi:hypothetical protein